MTQNSKSKQPTKTKFALQVIQTVTSRFKRLIHPVISRFKRVIQIFKVKGSVYALILSCIILFMPYVHVKYNPTDVEGILGFKWMSSFLFALALPSVLISSGLLLSYFSRFMEKQVVPFVKLLSFLVLVSGCFFLAWTFYTTPKDFEPSTYYSVLAILSIGFIFLFSLMHKAFIYTEEKLKAVVKRLFDFIILDTPKYVDKEKLKDYKVEYIELASEVSEQV